MRFKKGKFATWEEERKYRDNWQPWFAWHPVSVTNNQIAWLETVERRCVDGDTDYYHYRRVPTP